MFERTSLAPLRSFREHCVKANQIAIESQEIFAQPQKKWGSGLAI